MHIRRAIGLAVALMVTLAVRRAHAWQEAHQTGDDAQILVEHDGVASVQHELRWHVARGPLKWIDVVNVCPAAVMETKVAVVADDGRTLEAQASRRDEKTIRITFGDTRALMRGNFIFDVRWRIDLVASGSISRDGARWQLAVANPVAVDGFEMARTSIDLPAAPEGPRAIVAETGATDESAVATLRRGADRDVLDLVRLHVARGEATTWTVLVDPRAFPLIADPRLRSQSEATPAPEPDRVHVASLAVALASLALAFGLLVAHKGRALAQACAAHGERARGLLLLPHAVRATLAGVALAGGVGLESIGQTSAGAACVSLATLAAAVRPTSARPKPRGPGCWQALRPEQAFAAHVGETHWLDIGSSVGRLSALLVAALVCAVAVVASRFDAEGAWLVALDAAPLVPLFVTGRASQLPPHGAQSAVPWLARAFAILRSTAGVRVAPWARVAPDGVAADELRLLVMPQIAMPGVVGLEIGLAWSSTPTCWAAAPEVLARVLDGSPAAAKLARDVPRLRTVPGRHPDERVARLLPRAPTRSSTIALVCGLAEALTDRRQALGGASWTDIERRRVPTVVTPPHVCI